MWRYMKLPRGDGSKNFSDDHVVTTNFTYGEFKCKCCGTNHTSITLINMLQNARNHSNAVRRGTSYAINSAYRCPRHNGRSGGKVDSTHLTGLAVDIRARNSSERFAILYGLYKAGFTRIGIAKTFIHVDTSSTRSQNVAWVY